MNVKRSLIIACGALVVSAGLLAPLGQLSFASDGPRVVFEAMLSGAVVGTAILSLLVTPVLLACRWALGNRVSMPLGSWAAIGSLVALAPWVALNEPGGSVLAKLAITLDGMRSATTSAGWFPYLLGGAVLGWNLFKSQRPAHMRMEPARPDV